MLEEEVTGVLGGEERAHLLVGVCEHGGHQPASARPGHHVEVVGEPHVQSLVTLLQLLLDEAEDGAGTNHAHATSVDAEHDEDDLVRLRRRGHADEAERPTRHRV